MVVRCPRPQIPAVVPDVLSQPPSREIIGKTTGGRDIRRHNPIAGKSGQIGRVELQGSYVMCAVPVPNPLPRAATFLFRDRENNIGRDFVLHRC